MNLRRLTCTLALISLATPIAAFPQASLGEQLEEFSPALVFIKRDSKISGSQSRDMGALMYSWYMVQDSSMQLVWNEPSGIKRAFKTTGNVGYFDADIDMLPLSDIRAFEVHAMIFDIWRERLRTFSVTRIMAFGQGDDRSFDPRWYDAYRDLPGYATSLIWVDRVMLADGRILEADQAVVLAVAQKIGSDVTAADLLPERIAAPQEREGR